MGSSGAVIETPTPAGLLHGTGAPGAGLGVDGQFYFRTDGGALTSLYMKRAGVWVGIL